MSALGDGDCPLPTLSVGDTPEGLLSAVLGMTAKSSRELFILFRNISVILNSFFVCLCHVIVGSSTPIRKAHDYLQSAIHGDVRTVLPLTEN